MNCSKCNSELVAGEKFCRLCGTSSDAPPVTENTASSVTSEAYGGFVNTGAPAARGSFCQSLKRQFSQNSILIVCASVFVICIIALTVNVFLSGRTPTHRINHQRDINAVAERVNQYFDARTRSDLGSVLDVLSFNQRHTFLQGIPVEVGSFSDNVREYFLDYRSMIFNVESVHTYGDIATATVMVRMVRIDHDDEFFIQTVRLVRTNGIWYVAGISEFTDARELQNLVRFGVLS